MLLGNTVVGGTGWPSFFCSPNFPPAGDGSGGAVYSQGVLTLTHTSILTNTATGGFFDGSIYQTHVLPGPGLGGGLYALGGSVLLSQSVVASNTVSGGQADAAGPGLGGGLFVQDTSVVVANSTIGANTATTDGAGLFVASGSAALLYTTLASNTALSGTGGLATTVGVITATGTLLANNGLNCTGSLIDSGGNLQWPGTDCGPTIAAADPLLGPLIAVGGTWVYPLTLGSPAINAGATGACPAVDQLGVARPQGTACDVGAYEYVGLPVIFMPLVSSHPGGAVVSP
jgi:hypothetical protein